jgi:hypothetical protein
MSSEKRPRSVALDHSHHLSVVARRYDLSPLKGLQKYFSKDLIPFAGGPFVFVLLSHDRLTLWQACRVRITSPSPQSLLTSSPLTCSLSMLRGERRPLIRRLGGFGAYSVLAKTIRHASKSPVSRTRVTRGSTSPLPCSMVLQRVWRARKRSSASLQNAYTPPHTATGLRSSTRATRKGAASFVRVGLHPHANYVLAD